MFGIGADKQILSLDWDARSLRIAQWQVQKDRAYLLRPPLATHIPADVHVRDSAIFGLYLRRVLDQERIRISNVVVDIPRDQAVLNSLSLPAVNSDNLAGMVQLQIVKELPFPLGEAIVDFAVGSLESKETTVDVLVAAVRQEVVEFYREVCQQAQLKLERIGLRPYANRMAVGEMLKAESLGKILFVDVGPTLTEIDVLREGSLVFSRAASVNLDESEAAASDSDQQPEASADASADPNAWNLNRLVVEITRSAEAYRSTDPGARFDHIVVGGSSGLESSLAQLLSKRFMVSAQIYHPSSILKSESSQSGELTAFAAAIGLGIGSIADRGLHFDFLHPKKPMDAAARRKKHLPKVAAIAGVAVFVVGLVYGIGIYPYERELKEIRSQIEIMEKDFDRYDEVANVVKNVKSWQDRQVIWADELRLFIDLLPPNDQAYLENLDLDTDTGKIAFNLAAQDPSVIKEFLARVNELTQPGKKEGEVQRVFKASSGDIRPRDKQDSYRSQTQVSVVVMRIDELLAAGKKKRS